MAFRHGRKNKSVDLTSLRDMAERQAWKSVLDDICISKHDSYNEAVASKSGNGNLNIQEVYDYETNNSVYYVYDRTYYTHSDLRDMVGVDMGNWQENYLEEQFRLSRHASVYQVADRILTNQEVICEFNSVKEQPFPAFNDGTTITFNTEVIDTSDLDDDDFLITLTGLNYHEVAHLLWTPRQNSEFMKAVMEQELLIAFNVLEDNRIETFLSSKYPSVTPFLLQATYRYFLQNQSPMMFAIIGGRSYLPQELLDLFYEQFVMTVGEEVAIEIVGILNKYRTLVLPRDSEVALQLIARFAELLNAKGNGQTHKPQGEGSDSEGGDSEGGDIPSGLPNPLGGTPCSERKPMKSGRPQAGKQQDEIDKPQDYTPTTNPSDTKSDEPTEQDDNTNKNSGDTGESLDEVLVLSKLDDNSVCEHLRSDK